MTMFSVDASGWIRLGDRKAPCALGRGGVCPADSKREGDGRTPAGIWPLRRVLWRPDRGAAPTSGLPGEPITPDSGWCDDPSHGDYNRPVRLPHPARAERLWRDDHLYDRVVVIGHNDHPVIAGAGSAIFVHLATPAYGVTEGCVALAACDMDLFLRLAGPGDGLRIYPPGEADPG